MEPNAAVVSGRCLPATRGVLLATQVGARSSEGAGNLPTHLDVAMVPVGMEAVRMRVGARCQ